MPDYQKGKIYKLWSPQGNEIYIGSTINPLAKRLGQHKICQDCRSKYLFENYDVVKIELIEEYPCDSKIELNKREGHHIRNNTCLNRCIAGRTLKEYTEDNKEHKKEYYKNNKEHIKDYQKEYVENNKEYIKERNKEYAKEYRENNKEKINEKFDCDCGGKYVHNNKVRHLKSKIHIAFTNSHPSH